MSTVADSFGKLFDSSEQDQAHNGRPRNLRSALRTMPFSCPLGGNLVIRPISVSVGVVTLVLSAVSGWAADGLLLAAKTNDSQLRRVQVSLDVDGFVKHGRQDQSKQSSIRVDGSLAYHERLVRAGTELAAIRYYDKSQVKMNVDGTVVEPTLRDARRLIVVRPDETGMSLFSPTGTLRREELDMINVQGNTLILDRLLPGRTIETGQKWKVKNATLAALLTLDKLTLNSVEFKLDKLDSGVAHVAIQGQVGGTVDGSLTEAGVKGVLGFDIARRQVAWLVLKVDEKRMAGPAGPGVKISGRLRVTISPLATSEHLTRKALAGISIQPTAPLRLLRHDAASGRFRSWHDRRWHVIDEREHGTVMRMIDRGERIAQCNITVAEPPEENQQTLTLAKFRSEVEKAFGSVEAKVISSDEYTGRSGHKVFGVHCRGKVAGVPIAWHYYHVINTKSGHRATIVVTLEESRTTDLERTDLMLARSMQLLVVKKDVAKTAAPSKRQ